MTGIRRCTVALAWRDCASSKTLLPGIDLDEDGGHTNPTTWTLMTGIRRCTVALAWRDCASSETLLPAVALSGKHSIMRKTLLIYDDHGPVARGERMACSM
ncbi:Myosin regulatory light chain 2, partial [Operophtera brumata]